MTVDCTLNSFAVPGFSNLVPDFGVKKPVGEPVSSREAHVNIAMPFTLMRPHVVDENSTTTEVEVNSVFDITVAGITLEIGEAAYNRCKAHIINSSSGSVSVLVNETETITLFRDEIIDLNFARGKWRYRSPKECLRMLEAFDFSDADPVAASTQNVNTVTGGLLTVDGVALAAGDRVFLKDQTDSRQNGYWIAQSGSWNRDPSYSAGNTAGFTNKYISPKQGKQKGRLFYLVEDRYTVGTDALNFLESKFSIAPAPGKIPIYDKSAAPLSNDDRHSDMVDGMGRDLRIVFGIASTSPAVYIPLIMAELRRRCNNNGEIDNTGVPDFTGIEIGDYIDGLDLSGVAAAPSGNAPQAWNNTYKNNRIVVSGFNIYKGFGDTENAKNHILFTFRNIICQGQMKASNDNAGGYPVTLMRTWLEGSLGDGTGVFATKLKAALGGDTDYLYTLKLAHSIKGNYTWTKYTVFLPTEIEVLGYQTYGDEADQYNSNVQFPIYAKSGVYRIKRYNGARAYWWLGTPSAASSTTFVIVHNYGNVYYSNASYTGGGVAPAFCVA
ncbi:MAG: DUF6273 domain-containing protein [Spirochaetaceae bacterium]|jgi:hypothetical protein|nr:DUF6273 domain-containing protein [Spirochaetaceae bacterium]